MNEEAQPVFVTQLSPDNPTGSDQFGWSVDIDDGKILVGAHYLDANGNNSGQCFLYNIEENGSIVETDRFIGSDSANWDKFGGDVSISQNLIAVGSLESDATGPSKSGAAFYFRIEQNGTVTELQKIVDIPQVEQDRFGERVAIDGNLIAIGSPRADYESLNDSGQVTVLKVDAEGNVDGIAKLHSPTSKKDRVSARMCLLPANLWGHYPKEIMPYFSGSLRKRVEPLIISVLSVWTKRDIK